MGPKAAPSSQHRSIRSQEPAAPTDRAGGVYLEHHDFSDRLNSTDTAWHCRPSSICSSGSWCLCPDCHPWVYVVLLHPCSVVHQPSLELPDERPLRRRPTRKTGRGDLLRCPAHMAFFTASVIARCGT